MSSLSQKVGKRILRKRFRNVMREKGVQNFDSANSAIIVFDAMLPDCVDPIKDFVKFMKGYGILTSVYGYLPIKEIPDEMALWKNFEFITRVNINWYGSPKGEIAEKFFNTAPDLLFVVSFKENLTIEYLTQLSKARFKVGCYTENENDLDLMINPANKECEVSFLLEQVKHYINLLNPSK